MWNAHKAMGSALQKELGALPYFCFVINAKELKSYYWKSAANADNITFGSCHIFHSFFEGQFLMDRDASLLCECVSFKRIEPQKYPHTSECRDDNWHVHNTHASISRNTLWDKDFAISDEHATLHVVLLPDISAAGLTRSEVLCLPFLRHSNDAMATSFSSRSFLASLWESAHVVVQYWFSVGMPPWYSNPILARIAIRVFLRHGVLLRITGLISWYSHITSCNIPPAILSRFPLSPSFSSHSFCRYSIVDAAFMCYSLLPVQLYR